MPISELCLYNFRNIKNQKISVYYEQIFFLGMNGQGKTNFLEALYFLAYGRSFRSRYDEVMITNGCNEMSVSAKWHSEYMDRENQVTTDIAIKYVQKKKEITINEKATASRKDLLEYIPIIIFNHDDIEFITGPPDTRRRFFNQCLSRYQIDFIDTLQTYRRILKTRNQIIKEQEFKLLDVYNQQLAECGLAIARARQKLLVEFNKLFIPLFETISHFGEPVSIEYQPSWKMDDAAAIVNSLENSLAMDTRMGTTTSGPHRDKFLFKVNNRNFLHEASTGQIRLISLILRIVQARLYAQMSGRKPVLLVDDVLLEMDTEKRQRCMKELPDYDQIFFTFLPDENISIYKKENSVSYSVKDGEYMVI